MTAAEEPECDCRQPDCPLCSDASPCPRCGEWVPGLHEFGVLRHEECGYCAHPSRVGTEGGWRCEVCGAVEP